MIRLLTALAFIVVSTVAHAQQNLQVRGPITIGNCFKSASPTIAVDAGVTCGGGGGGTTPGGNPGQVQFNNSGSFGGIAGQTTDGTITTFGSSDFVLSGSISGSVTLNAPSTGGGTVTLPPGNTTLAGLSTPETFTAQQVFSNGLVVSGGTFTATGLVTNADLANSSVTVNGQVCTLGSSCFVTSAGVITIGVTTISGGTNGNIEFNNAGLVGEKGVSGSGNVVLVTSPTIASPTVTGAFTATGLVTNADLVNASVTVNSQTCTLGGSCTVGVGLVVGTTTITSGVAQGVLYQNNANVLGNTAAVSSQSLLFDANVTACPSLPFAVWSFCQVDSGNSGIGIYGNGGGGAALNFVNNAGTLASKTASTVSQTLMQILVQGYDGSAFQLGVQINCIPTQTWSGTVRGTKCQFLTTPNGSTTNTLALTIDQDQSITVAGGLKTTTGNFSGGLTTNVTGSTQCVQANSAGLLSGTGSACGGAVSSVSNSDSSLTISPTTGAVVASLNVGHANTWSATQTFPDGGAWSSSGLGVGGALSSTFNFTDNGSGAVILTGGNPGNIVGHYNGGNVPAVWGVQYVYTSLPQNRGIGIFIDVSHQDTTANHSATGMDINVSTPSTYSTTVNNLTAISPSVKHIGTGNVTSISTVLALAYLNSTATVTSMWPFRAILQSDAGGTVTNAVGFEIATPMGPTTAVTSVWTNISGIEILDQNPSVSGGGANTLTNPPSAIKIQSQTATGAFAIQQLGSGLNSFAGAATFSTSVTIGAGSAITSSGPGGVMGSNAFNSTAFAPLASPTFTGTVTMPDSSTFSTNFAVAGNAILTAPSAATLQHGAADGASPVAQIIKFQSGVGTNIAGVNTTIIGSLGSGNAASGKITFQVGGAVAGSGTTAATATNALSINGGVASPVVQVAQAGTAALPSLAIGNATTGIASVSTTGLIFSVNGASILDYGVTTASVITTGALTTTGLVKTSSNIVLTNNAGTVQLRNGSTIISSPNSAIVQLGTADAASPVAQTLQAQSVVAGNANTAGATFTIGGSKSNGSGGGDMVLQTTLSSAASGTQNTLATAVTFKGGNQQANFAGIISPQNGFTPTAGSGAASVAGNDQDFVVTTGTAQTSVAVNFGHTWGAAPVCVVTSNSTASVVDIASTTTTVITFGASVALTGSLINVHCFGT